MATRNGQAVSAEERAEMLDLHEKGYSVREIARTTGWSKAAVSRHLASMGADTDRSLTAEATAARVRKIQEQKLDLAEKLMTDSFDWRHRAWDEYIVVVAGPEGPSTIHMDEPPLRDQESAAKALAATVNTVDQLLNGIGNDEAAQSKNVLTNLVDGLAQLIGSDDGLGELDRDHDYDINDDPLEVPVDLDTEEAGEK